MHLEVKHSLVDPTPGTTMRVFNEEKKNQSVFCSLDGGSTTAVVAKFKVLQIMHFPYARARIFLLEVSSVLNPTSALVRQTLSTKFLLISR